MKNVSQSCNMYPVFNDVFVNSNIVIGSKDFTGRTKMDKHGMDYQECCWMDVIHSLEYTVEPQGYRDSEGGDS